MILIINILHYITKVLISIVPINYKITVKHMDLTTKLYKYLFSLFLSFYTQKISPLFQKLNVFLLIFKSCSHFITNLISVHKHVLLDMVDQVILGHTFCICWITTFPSPKPCGTCGREIKIKSPIMLLWAYNDAIVRNRFSSK
jgi:hypothetical protein